MAHATVVAVEKCTETDDSSAWTYVTFEVNDSTGALQDEDAFVVRQKVGTYSDSVGGLFGTPLFAVGDEVFAVLHFDERGAQSWSTLRPAGDDVWWVVEDERGRSVLVDARGRLAVVGHGGVRGGTAEVPGLRRTFPEGVDGREDDRLRAWLAEVPTRAAVERVRGRISLTFGEDSCTRLVSASPLDGFVHLEATCNLDGIGSVTAIVATEEDVTRPTLEVFETPPEGEETSWRSGEAVSLDRFAVGEGGALTAATSAETPAGRSVAVAVEYETFGGFEVASRDDLLEELFSLESSRSVAGRSFDRSSETCRTIE